MKNRKTVLHLRCSSALLGAENVVLELAELSSLYGFRSIIGVIQDSRDPVPELAKQAESRGISYTIFNAAVKIDLSCIRRIRNYINEQNIDVVHSHGYREDIYSLLSLTNAKKVATNHLWKKTNFTLKLYALTDALFLSRFDLVAAVSRPIYEEMARIPILRAEKLVIIANGVDTRKFHPHSYSLLKPELGVAPTTAIIGTLSSLTPEKGHCDLLLALSALKQGRSDFHAVFIGEGPERQKIESLAKELHLSSHVTLLGARFDVSALLAGMDIFALPSLKEGLPMALLEAMATGLPIVASDVGDVSQLVCSDETGFLVPPADPHAIRIALDRLLSDGHLRHRLGTAAANLVRSQYESKIMAQKYCEQYQRLIASQVSGPE